MEPLLSCCVPGGRDRGRKEGGSGGRGGREGERDGVEGRDRGRKEGGSGGSGGRGGREGERDGVEGRERGREGGREGRETEAGKGEREGKKTIDYKSHAAVSYPLELAYHIWSLILFPSSSMVLILKSIPGERKKE